MGGLWWAIRKTIKREPMEDTCTANPIWNKAIRLGTRFPHHHIDGLFLDLLRPPFRVNGKEVIGCTLVANRPVASRRHVRFADTYFGGRSFRGFHDLPSVLTEGRSSSDHFADGKDRL